MKTVEDPRTVNKMVHFRPACNYLNMNELASLWERKIGKTLPRVTVTEADLLAAAAKNVIPQSIVASFTHDIFIKGCQVDFEIQGPNEVEIQELYPDVTYKTVDECFGEFVVSSPGDDQDDIDIDIDVAAAAAGINKHHKQHTNHNKKEASSAVAASNKSSTHVNVMEILPIPAMC